MDIVYGIYHTEHIKTILEFLKNVSLTHFWFLVLDSLVIDKNNETAKEIAPYYK